MSDGSDVLTSSDEEEEVRRRRRPLASVVTTARSRSERTSPRADKDGSNRLRRLERKQLKLQSEQTDLEKQRRALAQNQDEDRLRIASNKSKVDKTIALATRASRRMDRVDAILNRICDHCHSISCLVATVDVTGPAGVCSICGDHVGHPIQAAFHVDDGVNQTRSEAYALAKKLKDDALSARIKCLKKLDDVEYKKRSNEDELARVSTRISQNETKLERYATQLKDLKVQEAQEELARAQQRLTALGVSPPEPTASPAGGSSSDAVDANQCSICYENTVDTSLKCGHLFCRACVDKSLKRGIKTCATCRAPVVKYDLRTVYGINSATPRLS